MIGRRRFVALTAVAPLLAAVIPRDAGAQGQGQPARLRVEILVLYAKKDPAGGHVDPRVPKLPQLTQAPFNEFKTYAFIDQKTLVLDTPKSAPPWWGKPSATYALVTGKTLDVTFLEDRDDKRVKLGVLLGDDAADRVKWIAPVGQPFFIAGQTYKDGILVIGITLKG